ncbi:diheme cytochrome c-553 [Flavitalea sp. BT771]|uniref:diheme cytochrome c-553 n=1 Tax=Flavitalea sp. BT771 TaxID=3063329 RepID=UPI0026E36D5C|nr:diheme cytochrome c-553 [Flavitalea sp. BT771]MDO6434916.1 diheme cytochrome c-553 [Flavitalea sp. BT771]MDV6223816.1 diheme cytochrome c-553 [Flavitalea sp. BT771]
MRNVIFIIAALLVSMLLVTGVSCHDTGKGNGIGVAATDPVAAGKDTSKMVKRGEYLVSSIGCDDCHSPKKMGPHGPEVDAELRLSGYPAGRPLAAFDTTTAKSWALFNQDLTACVGPWGISFAGNITSDATGIGNWTEEQFIKCLREGKWKGLDNARPLMPPMPWQNFRKLTDEDLGSIYYYLKTTKAVNNTVPAWIPPGQSKNKL